MKASSRIGLIALILVSVLIGCSGYRYAKMPALSFDDIDYGYVTKKTKGEIPISYIETGTGTKTLLLVHGLASNAGFWRYTIPELAKKYQVIAIDLPGYGKSNKGDHSYSMDFYATQINEFLEQKNLDKVVFVGHSMGGQIGLTFALKYPDKLEKLVLAAPAGVESFKPGEAKWLRNVFRIDEITASGEEIIRANLNRNFYRWDDKYEWMVEERIRMAKNQEMPAFAHAVIQSVGAMLDGPTTNKLDQIKVESLIIYGENDGLIPNPFLHPGFTADVFAKAKETMPDVRLVEIPKCGHLLQIEKPQIFSQHIIDFVK
jgi:pimeloyl-ACP methyl ester carboxylesterase